MMDIDILWWHWLVFGLVLIAGELVAPGGFYIIFFGVAAVVVGLMARVGVAGPLWMQLVLFLVLSIGSLWFFRSRVLAWFQKDREGPPVDTLVGQSCRSIEELPPGATAKWNFAARRGPHGTRPTRASGATRAVELFELMG